MTGCGTWCYVLVGVVVFGQRLDSMILEIFPSLNDSMIPWFYKQSSQSAGGGCGGGVSTEGAQLCLGTRTVS